MRSAILAGALSVARLLWQVMRLAIFTCLSIFEPLVRFVLASLALLGMLTALFLELVVQHPGFPFWVMFGSSAGCAGLLLVYYFLMRVFSPRA